MCGRFSGRVHEVVTAVSDEEKAAVRKLLRKPGAKEEFLRRFSASEVTKEDVDRISREGDMVTFFAYLVLEGPAMRVEWEMRDREVRYEDTSVALYVFAGAWFVSINGSRLSAAAAFSSPRKAVLSHEGHLKFGKEDEWWRSYCGVYRSYRSEAGLKQISATIADEIVTLLTSLHNPISHGDGNQYEVLWGEVDADVPYFDPCHDEVGKAVRRVQTLKATKGKKEEYLKASQKLKDLMMAEGYQRLMFRRGESGFRGVADSVVKRVGFSARGNLLAFRGKWVRMFYDEQYGFNLFLLVREIEMPRPVSRDMLKAVGPYEGGELENWQGNRVPPHWEEMEVDGKRCRFNGEEWKPYETQ
jgi:hypothetical protein